MRKRPVSRSAVPSGMNCANAESLPPSSSESAVVQLTMHEMLAQDLVKAKNFQTKAVRYGLEQEQAALAGECKSCCHHTLCFLLLPFPVPGK